MPNVGSKIKRSGQGLIGDNRDIQNDSNVQGRTTRDALNALLGRTGDLNNFVRKETVVETEAELEEAKSQTGLLEVFNEWKRFAHRGNVGVEFITGSNGSNIHISNLYKYDEINGNIYQDINTSQAVGLISNLKYNNYVHRVRLSADTTDDDLMGVVLAYNPIEYGQVENTLSFMIRPNFGGNTNEPSNTINKTEGSIRYNITQPSQSIIEKLYWVSNNNDHYSWGDSNGGYLVEIERKPEEIIIKASQPGESELEPIYTVDLNSDERLHQFKKPLQYGYVMKSTPNSTYSERYFSEPDRYIFDISKPHQNRLWSFVNGDWFISEDKDFSEVLTPGHIAFNRYTDKVYFVQGDPYGVFRFATNII